MYEVKVAISRPEPALPAADAGITRKSGLWVRRSSACSRPSRCRCPDRRSRRGRVPGLLREVNQDSDGPVEFCWPVPQDQAPARRQPSRLTLRTELRTRRSTFIWTGRDGGAVASVGDSAIAWAAEQQRQVSDLGLRVTLLTTIAPVTDASRRAQRPDPPLRDRRRRMKTRGVIYDAGPHTGRPDPLRAQ